jgi:hypothetical protein
MRAKLVAKIPFFRFIAIVCSEMSNCNIIARNSIHPALQKLKIRISPTLKGGGFSVSFMLIFNIIAIFLRRFLPLGSGKRTGGEKVIVDGESIIKTFQSRLIAIV